MKLKSQFLSVLISGVLIFIFASTVWSSNKSSSEIDALLKDEQKELKSLKRKIAKQEKLISSVGKKEGQLLGNLKKINNQIKLKKRELKIYKWNSLINKKKLAKLEKKLKVTKIELDAQKVILGKRFRQIYKEGPVYPLKVAFSSESVGDLIERLKYMELIAEYDASLTEKFNNQLEGLNSEKQSLLAVKAKLVRLEKDALGKQDEFAKARKDKKIFLNKVKKKKKLGIQTRKELLKASNNLNDLIANIITKLVSGAGLDISDKKGRLSLPVKGKILNKFGRQKNKQFGSFIVNNGINIRSKTGMSVRSIFDGKVLYTGELDGYGNMVIVGHGKDYHSLYGHLDKIKVKQNQVIQTGDIIGLSGDTGSLVGETLYFEMRKNGKPVEPVRWFKVARR
jgi:murein hydrolase activator